MQSVLSNALPHLELLRAACAPVAVFVFCVQVVMFPKSTTLNLHKLPTVTGVSDGRVQVCTSIKQTSHTSECLYCFCGLRILIASWGDQVCAFFLELFHTIISFYVN